MLKRFVPGFAVDDDGITAFFAAFRRRLMVISSTSRRLRHDILFGDASGMMNVK